MRLRSKVLVLLLTIIMLPLIFGISYTYLNIKGSILQIERDNAKADIASAKAYIDLLVKNHESNYTAWTLWDDYYDAVAKKDENWIKDNTFSSVKEDSSNEVLAVLNNDGSILAQANLPKDWEQINFNSLGLFKKLNTETNYASGILKTSDGLYITTIVKIVKGDDENFQYPDGFTVFARKIKDSLLEDGKSVMGIDIVIALNDGKVVSSSKDKNFGKLDIKSFISASDIKISSQVAKDNILTKTEQIFTDVYNNPVGVLHVESVSKAGVTALNALAFNSVILFIVLGLFVIAGAWIIGLSLKPLGLLVQAAQRIADGDLTEKESDIKSFNKYNCQKDEIGEFSRAFGVMRKNLSSMIARVSMSVSKVTDTSRVLSEISNQTGAATEQVARAISEIAEGSSRQADHASEILKMMEDTQSQVEEGYKEVEKTVDSALTSTRVARQGRNSIEQAIDRIKTTTETVNASSQSVQELARHSKEIGGIITAITDISNQTNLLALNAAIESARAGEYGRGFSVVADEIRKLAEESNKEAKQIEALIKDIQSGTSFTVKNMESNLRAVESQVNMVQKGGEALSVIVENVEQTERESRQMQAIFTRLKDYTQNVLHSIREISGIIEESAAVAEQMSATAQQQTAAVNEIANSSVELAGLATELQSEMNKFKL